MVLSVSPAPPGCSHWGPGPTCTTGLQRSGNGGGSTSTAPPAAPSVRTNGKPQTSSDHQRPRWTSGRGQRRLPERPITTAPGTGGRRKPHPRRQHCFGQTSVSSTAHAFSLPQCEPDTRPPGRGFNSQPPSSHLLPPHPVFWKRSSHPQPPFTDTQSAPGTGVFCAETWEGC